VDHLSSGVAPSQPQIASLEAPPGFPPLFPELSKEEHKMAMMYISHSDETERLARIERVKQGIADNAREASLRLVRITNEFDKGKGHVYHYPDSLAKPISLEARLGSSSSQPKNIIIEEEEAESSDTLSAAFSAPAHISTGFQLGPSSEGRVSRKLNSGKTQRKRPSSWKRKSTTPLQEALTTIPAEESDLSAVPSAKRKQSSSKDDPSRSRFFFDKRLINKAGFEELVKQSWGSTEQDSSNTMDSIGCCRRNILKWKKKADNLRSMNSFDQSLVTNAPKEANSIALQVASSVTRDQRFQSYMANGGPNWLSSSITAEAVNARSTSTIPSGH
ncbi:hypothetical protein HID58_066064, partial [Brassica napus]